MKKCLILTVCLVLLAACTQETELSIAPDIASYQFDADGGAFDVVIFTNGSWTATCEDPAVSFSPTSGDYTTPMHIAVGANDEHFTKAIRIDLITRLDGSSRTGRIVITQSCRPFIFSEESLLQAPASGADVRFHVNSNDPWKVEQTTCDGEPVALTVDPEREGPNSVEVMVRIPENPTGHPRTFTVKLALEAHPEESVVLMVIQEA